MLADSRIFLTPIELQFIGLSHNEARAVAIIDSFAGGLSCDTVIYLSPDAVIGNVSFQGS